VSKGSGSVSYHWATVGQVLQQRMSEREVTPSDLAKVGGLSPNTVKDILKGANAEHPKNSRQAPLIVAAVVLELPWDYLTRVRDGVPVEVLDAEIATQAAVEEAFRSPIELAYRRRLQMDPQIAELKSAVNTMARIIQELTGTAED
jgi:transcriptional regulator with XRE-family HTH domain